jgi:hypothetical protein
MCELVTSIVVWGDNFSRGIGVLSGLATSRLPKIVPPAADAEDVDRAFPDDGPPNERHYVYIIAVICTSLP